MKAPGICSTDDPLPRMLIDWSGAPSPGDGPQGRQVVGILNPDGNANERRRDIHPQPFFFRDVRMSHRRRMRSKRLELRGRVGRGVPEPV
jgi:hypothetical protein